MWAVLSVPMFTTTADLPCRSTCMVAMSQALKVTWVAYMGLVVDWAETV